MRLYEFLADHILWTTKKPGKCPDESTINENYEMSGPDAELEFGGPRFGNPIPGNPWERRAPARHPPPKSKTPQTAATKPKSTHPPHRADN